MPDRRNARMALPQAAGRKRVRTPHLSLRRTRRQLHWQTITIDHHKNLVVIPPQDPPKD